MNILNIMNYSHLKFRPLDIEFARDREGWLKFPLMLQLFGAKIPMRKCGHWASQWMLCSLSRHHLFDINIDEFKVMYVMLVCVCVLLLNECFHWKNRRSSRWFLHVLCLIYVLCLRSYNRHFRNQPNVTPFRTRQCPRQLQKLPLFIIVQDRGWNMDKPRRSKRWWEDPTKSEAI